LEGAVRCDANVSIGEGTRVEIKNIGSFKEVEKALSYEITRQKTMFAREIEIKAETRHWDEARKITKQARGKETEEDYRYFPEPDLPTIEVDNSFLLALKRNMPELPDQRKRRFITCYGLGDHVSQVLIDNKELSDFFESAIAIYPAPIAIANWIVSDLIKFINTNNPSQSQQNAEGSTSISELKIEAKHIAELAKLVDQDIISRTTAKGLINQIIKTGEMPSQLVQKTNASKIADQAIILEAIEAVFKDEQSAVNDARQNSKATNFLLGKIMHLTKGKADPKITLDLIKKKLIEYT
jgi:aspartyl-tRNA(Asn)/glutamyl-tRNA(Gln) amidotransferase subunit B